MIPDDKILPTCYFWASRLRTKNIPFDELVNVGYEAAKELRDSKLVQTWVRYKMIHYVAYKSKGTYKTSPGAIYPVPLEELPEKFDSSQARAVELVEFQEDMRATIDKACSREERALLSMRFWQGMKVMEISGVLGITHPSVSVRLKKVLEKLRRAYERR